MTQWLYKLEKEKDETNSMCMHNDNDIECGGSATMFVNQRCYTILLGQSILMSFFGRAWEAVGFASVWYKISCDSSSKSNDISFSTELELNVVNMKYMVRTKNQQNLFDDQRRRKKKTKKQSY